MKASTNLLSPDFYDYASRLVMSLFARQSAQVFGEINQTLEYLSYQPEAEALQKKLADSFGIRRTSMVGAGTYALVFGVNDEQVVRVTCHQTEAIMLESKKLRDYPYFLAPIAAEDWRSPSGLVYRLEILPKISVLEQALPSSREEQAINELIAVAAIDGFDIHDKKAENFGWMVGADGITRLVYLDGGGIAQHPPTATADTSHHTNWLDQHSQNFQQVLTAKAEEKLLNSSALHHRAVELQRQGQQGKDDIHFYLTDKFGITPADYGDISAGRYKIITDKEGGSNLVISNSAGATRSYQGGDGTYCHPNLPAGTIWKPLSL